MIQRILIKYKWHLSWNQVIISIAYYHSNARKASKTEDGSGKRVSYQSFQRTVEQLSLDTIQSSESSGITLETNSANGSIFYSKLQHWDEMNLSQGFVEFKKAVKTFSNLPLVIFNQRQVSQSWSFFDLS